MYIKQTFYQDRLGTNIGKRTQNKDRFSSGVRAGRPGPGAVRDEDPELLLPDLAGAEASRLNCPQPNVRYIAAPANI